MHTHSFLKWAGGKGNALPHVFRTVPTAGDVWIEPFVGSGTVALNTNYKKYILNDSNADLITLFKMVCADPKGFILDLPQYFKDEFNEKSAFTELRAQFNASTDDWERSLLFVYLNRHCYNGLMRYNKSGLFNTSFGRYKKPLIPEDAILEFSQKFKKAIFLHGCFSELPLGKTKVASVIYCDPPYIPLSKTASFTSYTKTGFKPEDHDSLNEIAVAWKKKGHTVFISNSDAPLIDKHYPDRTRDERFDVRRSISQSGGKREASGEILMSY